MEGPTLAIACHEGRPPADASSSILAARSQYLLDLLVQIPDLRNRRGHRHLLAGLGAARGATEESTFRRAFALVDPGRLGQVMGA